DVIEDRTHFARSIGVFDRFNHGYIPSGECPDFEVRARGRHEYGELRHRDISALCWSRAGRLASLAGARKAAELPPFALTKVIRDASMDAQNRRIRASMTTY